MGIWNKKQIFTIPNLLSAIRILLIPVILWLYLVRQAYPAAVAVIILSGLTDVLDGYIARKFHMVSDFGKILDPVADKLTQGTLILCLAVRYPLMRVVIVLFLLRELMLSICGCVAIHRHQEVRSAQWFGKMSTATMYISMVLLILLPGLPEPVVTATGIICICVIVFSMAMYGRFYKTYI